MSSNRVVHTVGSLGKGLALVLVVLSTITYFVSLVLGPILFFSTSDGLSVAARPAHQLPVDVFTVIQIPIPLFGVVSLGVLFAAIWGAFVLCFLLAWLSRGGFPKSIKEALSKPFAMARTNFLFLMPLLATGLLYATVIIEQFQATQGVQTGSLNFPPSTSPYLILLNLAFAPISEEIGFRITSIGLPVGIVLVVAIFRSDPRLAGLVNKIKLILLAMLSPEAAKRKMGYRSVSTDGLLHGITLLEWVLILLTAFAFGSAHLLLGGGWEIGKVTTAFLAGFVFGIAYVAYGAYASILLHWFFDYYFTVLEMGGTTYGSAMSVFSNLTEGLTLGAGAVVLVVFLIWTAVRMSKWLAVRATGMTAGNP
jgi:membrane protease YdiL (CAAX protease family)